MRPKPPEVNVEFGALKFTLLKMLKNSALN